MFGCTRGPHPTTSGDQRVRTLEVRTKQLEYDLVSAQSAKDQFKKKLHSAEEQQGQLQQELTRLQKELNQITKDRDDALLVVKTRTTERDQLQSQYDGFRKNLKELIGQAEISSNKPRESDPGVTVSFNH